MDDQQSFDLLFDGLTAGETFQPNDMTQFPNDNSDLSALIEQSLTPLSVGNIINTMNHNNMVQQHLHEFQPTTTTITQLDPVSMYHLLSGNLNGGVPPIVIVNMQHAIATPPTPSAEMSKMNLREPIAGIAQEEEPPYKKRRPSVVDEDIMSLAHQMDLLRRNSLPVLHSIHVPRPTLQQSISVDELLSPSKFIRDDIGLLEDSGGEIINLHNEDGEDELEPLPDSPPTNQRSPFDFGNFFMPPPPPKNVSQNVASTQQHVTIVQTQPAPQPLQIQTQVSPPSQEQQKKIVPKRRKSAPVETSPTPGTPVDGRKLVCLGKRPRKNKKTQPEDQYLLKFTMRRNK